MHTVHIVTPPAEKNPVSQLVHGVALSKSISALPGLHSVHAEEAMDEAALNAMATAIVEKLDIDGNGEISMDELMAWFDAYPDADVSDIFSLLKSVVASTDYTAATAVAAA